MILLSHTETLWVNWFAVQQNILMPSDFVFSLNWLQTNPSYVEIIVAAHIFSKTAFLQESSSHQVFPRRRELQKAKQGARKGMSNRNTLAWMWQQVNRNPHTTLASRQELRWRVMEKLGIMHRCAIGSNNTLFSLPEFPPFSHGTLPESVLQLYWGGISHLLLFFLSQTHTQSLS